MPDEPTVLLVDDDPAMLRMLEVNFRLSGFIVRTSLRGDEAVELAIATPPDALVLDVMMPGLDGFEVARRLRREPSLARMPIVFLTARSQDDDRAQGEAVGGSEFVTKPFDPAVLVETVRRRLADLDTP
jgi:two-component system, OmpR family, alkaline phosphatase synthesis response regulator PhoP